MQHEMTRLKRNLILVNACMSTFMATLDGSIVNISLPVISEYFNVNISSVQWIVSSYLLAISATLLFWGKLSDLFGRKYLFATGMGIFTIGSFLCGVSFSFPMLVLSRVIQALGAGIMMALNQGIVTSIFPSNERGKALGILGTTVAIGSLIGPSLGGLLVHTAGWQSIFIVNIPVGILGVILTLILMNVSGNPVEKKKIDIGGSLLFAISIITLFLGFLSLQDKILPTGISLLMVVIAILLLISFVFFEKKQEIPLLDIDLFRNPIFTISLITAYISYLAMFAYIFFAPFYLQYVLHMSILEAGLLMSIYPITTGLISPMSGHLSDRKPHIPLTVIGLLINSVALVLFSTLDANSSKVMIGLLIMCLGIGSAIFQSPNTSFIMGSVTRDKLGVAGSVSALFRNLGMVSGTTISVTIFMMVTKIGIENITVNFDTTVFLKGFKIVLQTSAGLAFIGALLSFIRSKRKELKGKSKATVD